MDDLVFTIVKMVVMAVAAIIGVVITRYAIPWINSLKDDANYAQLISIVEAGVKAAEQVFKEPQSGAQKKQHVIEFVTKWLNDAGIEITESQLSELIEAAVFNMHLEQDGVDVDEPVLSLEDKADGE